MESEEKASQIFYELCYDQYKLELEEADKLYQKVSIILIVLPILAGTILRIGRADLLDQLFMKKEILFYYFSFLASWLLIGAGAVFAICCVVPRNYQRIGDMIDWQDWRKRYQKYIDESKVNETLDDAMLRDICVKLANAQKTNVLINENRRQYFQKSVLMASLCMIPLISQAILYLILRIQGV
jgi:hypothetical protein